MKFPNLHAVIDTRCVIRILLLGVSEAQNHELSKISGFADTWGVSTDFIANEGSI